MTVAPELLFAGAGALVTVTAWLYRVQSRVDVHDEQHRQHDEAIDDVRQDVRYIRDRIDRALSDRYDR
jgi:hypothetical protein